MRSHAERIHGFAIVSAIFILVVLAALGAFIVNISTSQHIGSALDVQGVRAYSAARAGLEWGLYQVQGTAAYACPAATTSFVPAAATLADFTITVECAATADGSSGPTIYSITATACSQPVAGWTANTTACPNIANPGPLYVERRVSVTF